ncbi:MAG: hypothetical protein NTU88_07965, partial [Armatimonadetes bacterium]|nr:hypothetical protein [Armatimonadota bacterium]
KRWQRAFTGLPAPTFDALVEMASMTWPQVQGIISNSGRWFGVPGLRSQSDAEIPLKLYTSLGAGRQQALWQGAEIPVSDLTPAQQTLFMQALEEKQRPSYARAQDASWPQAATISLRNHALEDESLFATWNMRGLGTVDMADLMPETPSPTPGGDTSIEEDRRAQEALDQHIQAELPNLAKKAAEVIAGKHLLPAAFRHDREGLCPLIFREAPVAVVTAHAD